MTKSEETILNRVRHLLALATSSNPHEAALAAERAQELIQKYTLDLSKLHKERDGKPLLLKKQTGTGTKNNWAHSLLQSLAKANFCRAIGTRKAVAWIVGEEQNIQVVEYLYQYCYRELGRMARTGYATSTKVLSFDQYKTSFCNGAVQVIAARLQAQTARFAEAEESRALVVVKDADLEEAYRQFFPSTSQSRALRSYASAYQAGQAAAADLHLNAGVGAANQQRSLPHPK